MSWGFPGWGFPLMTSPCFLKMAAASSLFVDRELIDPEFDGYKLSLDPLPTYRVSLDTGVDAPLLTEQQYSFQHVKAFGCHNHLVLDPWNTNRVFFVDANWVVQQLQAHQDTSLERPLNVFSIPEESSRQQLTGRVNVSLQLVHLEWAVLSDGTGQLYILHTGDRNSGKTWQVCFNDTVCGTECFFKIVHSVVHGSNTGLQMECLLLHVDCQEGQTENTETTAFQTVLDWLTFSLDADKNSWSVTRRRRLLGGACPDYAAIQSCGSAVIVAAGKPVTLVEDSLKPVQPPPAPVQTGSGEPAYTWSQDHEEVVVMFNMADGVDKSQILFKLTPDSVDLSLHGGPSLLQGALYANVDVEGSTWTLNDSRLELTLSKTSADLWAQVVCGDDRGQLLLSEDQQQHVRESLNHLTSNGSTGNVSALGSQPAYNSQELEDCDAFPDDTSVLLRVDGEEHCVSHQASLGSHQFLFSVPGDPGSPPLLCLRHDVDGLVWQPAASGCPGDDPPWKHVATFNALGYVQASKSDRRFAACPPDYSYAVLCDCVRHLYIYRQPAAISTPLRNRKSGRQVGAVAKQQVVSLDSTDNIMGLQVTNKRMFIIAGKMLYMVRVNQD